MDMNVSNRPIPESLIEIYQIEVNDNTLQLPMPSVQDILDPQIKLEKIFLHYHILQKINNL